MTDFGYNRHGRSNVRKELKAAISLHGRKRDEHSSESADKRIVVRSLIIAGYSHQEIDTALDELLRNGELYEPTDGEVAVV